MLRKIFAGIMLTLSLIASQLSVYPIRATVVRVPGVHAGDWAKYGLFFNYTTNDPNPPSESQGGPPPEFAYIQYFKIEVLSLLGTKITFQLTGHFNNGTEMSNVVETDVSDYGGDMFFIAANLSAGDSVFPKSDSPTINATLIRTYAGAEREVNYVGLFQNGTWPYDYTTIAEGHICWDRATGILDELIQKMNLTKVSEGYVTYYSVHFIIKETNIWSPEYIPAEVNVTPKSLNLRSEGKWITAYIELPEGYKLKDADVSTIMLNGTILAEIKSKANGSPHLIVKFDRAKVMEYILSNVNIEERFMTITLTVTGHFNDGRSFKGSDIIKTIWTIRRYEDS